MALFTIQELSNHLSTDFLQQTQNDINWHQLKRMRNYFGHEYDEMDEEIIFKSAQNDIPILYKFLINQRSIILNNAETINNQNNTINLKQGTKTTSEFSENIDKEEDEDEL